MYMYMFSSRPLALGFDIIIYFTGHALSDFGGLEYGTAGVGKVMEIELT